MWEILTDVIVNNSETIVTAVITFLGGWLGLSKPKDKAELKSYESVKKVYDDSTDILGRDS